MMKKMLMGCLVMAFCAIGCAKTEQKSGNETTEQSAVGKVAADEGVMEGADVPPVFTLCVKGLPLFAPFNEGDLLNEGKALRETPAKYTKLIIGESVFDVSYKEEKNKQLEHDDSYMNQYVYKTKDEMKGQLYTYVDAKALEEYMQTHGDTSAEGELYPMEYAYGILVSADYLKDRSVMKSFATTTEDPTEPQFSASVIAKVEKMVGAKVESNRIAQVIGNDEYNFGVMKTKPNDEYALAVWVLAKGDEVCIHTDTCMVEGGEVMWSNYDPEEYMEPGILAVVKGKNGLDIYCSHASTDETVNYMLMRQEGTRMRKYDMGGFYQMYE